MSTDTTTERQRVMLVILEAHDLLEAVASEYEPPTNVSEIVAGAEARAVPGHPYFGDTASVLADVAAAMFQRGEFDLATGAVTLFTEHGYQKREAATA